MGYLPSAKLLLISLIVCIGGPFQHGFQAVVTSPAQQAFTDFLNSSIYLHYGWELPRSSVQVNTYMS